MAPPVARGRCPVAGGQQGSRVIWRAVEEGGAGIAWVEQTGRPLSRRASFEGVRPRPPAHAWFVGTLQQSRWSRGIADHDSIRAPQSRLLRAGLRQEPEPLRE